MQKILELMKNKLYLIISFIVGVVLIYSVLKPKTVLVEIASVKTGHFVQSIRLDGKVKAKNRYVIYAPADGQLKRIEKEIGDNVTKNEILATIDSDRKWSMKTPTAGVISQIQRKSSGPILRGEPILEVINLDDLQIIVEALTPDSVRMQIGNKVNIYGWGGEPLKGRVDQIKKVAQIKVSALGVEEERVEVVIKFDSFNKQSEPTIENSQAEFAQLGDNFHVDTDIIINEMDNVILAPVGALFRQDDDWAVYVVEKNKAVLRKVQLLDKNSREFVVSKGLSEKDNVIVYPGDVVKEGVAVKIIL